MNKIFHLFSYHLAVFPLFFSLLYIWLQQKLNLNIIIFVFILPVLYGYITPFIATTILKKWKFNNGLKIGEIYYHHGFKVASHLILFLSIALVGHTAKDEFTLVQMVSISFCVGSMEGFFIWIHDVFALKYGYITMSRDHYNINVEPEVMSFRFSPVIFFSLGFTYSFCALIYNNIALLDLSGNCLFAAISSAFLLINIILGTLYFFCEKNMR